MGKPILVNLWATWCGPCRRELPHFEKYYKEYGDDIQFLMVDVWEDKYYQSTVKGFLKDNGYTFPVLYDYDDEATLSYNVEGIPTTLAVNSKASL